MLRAPQGGWCLVGFNRPSERLKEEKMNKVQKQDVLPVFWPGAAALQHILGSKMKSAA